MGLLREAAESWKRLERVTYHLSLGRKKLPAPLKLTLEFQPKQFPHLAGFQYIQRKPKLSAKSLLAKLSSGNMDDSFIEKEPEWERMIKGRLLCLLRLEAALDSNFLIYQFLPGQVRGGTTIQADYVIRNPANEGIFFVFIGTDGETGFCKSLFPYTGRDFSENQPVLKVLDKRKVFLAAEVQTGLRGDRQGGSL